jgi:polysaccharide deacetylase family protein (PEP-CTERM system associated)
VTSTHPDADRSTAGSGQRTDPSRRQRPRALLTISLEDYFHVGSFGSLIPRGQWYRFESRVEHGVARTLDLLDEQGATATVFVLGIVAERFPELVRAVRERGHEVASKGYQHRLIQDLPPSALAEDLQRAREAIEGATGEAVAGCRISGWLTPRDAWALDVMADHGYWYDSSMRPFLRSHAWVPAARRPHLHRSDAMRSIWEIPVSSLSLLGCDLPLGGGNWMRQLPQSVVRRGLAHLAHDENPVVLYFHSWELDPDQPRLEGASSMARLRHYRNLHHMPDRLRHYLRRFECGPIATWLAAHARPAEPPPVRAIGPRRMSVHALATGPALLPPARSLPRVSVSVVIPCFNEERALPYLANTLQRLESSLGSAYDLRFVVVDDGSTDETLVRARALFADWANVTVARHDRNRGQAAAILTGALASTTEIVCTMDCDSRFDPHELARMIPRLRSGVDLVVASPFHPDGVARRVPRVQRALSASLAACYRRLLRQALHCYTSSFRVYRRRALLALHVRRGGPVGVTEILARLDLAGGTIVEHPVTPDARIFGRSRWHVARAIAGHAGLLAELAWHRLRGARTHATRIEPARVEPARVAAHGGVR